MSTSSTDTTPNPDTTPATGTKLTSTWAVLGLVFAFLFWPLGVLFSVLGLRETGNRGPRAGRGLAIAGLIVSVVAIITSIIVIAFLVLAAGGTVKAVNDAASSTGSSAAAGAPSGAEADVVIDSCKASDLGAEAEVTITNSTDSAKSYLVSISGNDAGGQRVSELSTTSNSIAPGQSAKVQAIGTLADGTTITDCKVADVTRF